MKDLRDYSLLHHNTFGIDARCRRFLEYSTVDEAVTVAAALQAEGKPYLVVGAGSNLLLTADYNGTVVHSALRGVSMTEDADGCAHLCCGSGERWDDVVAWTVEMGFHSLANLSAIPGDVGASAVQNIGAYGAEAAQFIERVDAIEVSTGSRVSIAGKDCGYGYRDSRFKHEWKGKYLITHVCYALQRHVPLNLSYGHLKDLLDAQGASEPTPQQLRHAIEHIRNEKLPDPAMLGNAGSFFMNPVVEHEVFLLLQKAHPSMPHYVHDEQRGLVKIPAGWLIEQCGWKGRSLGQAGVYQRQALVLVNLGGASGQEVVALCQAIRRDVSEHFGIDLKPEVNIV